MRFVRFARLFEFLLEAFALLGVFGFELLFDTFVKDRIDIDLCPAFGTSNGYGFAHDDSLRIDKDIV